MTHSIDDDNLLAEVQRLPPEALDALPFGVIRLDADGVVTYFSQAEAQQSGVGHRSVIGRRFFAELAPCMWTPEFQQRYDQAVAAGTLDVTFDQVGDFSDRTRHIRVRARSAPGGGVWLFIDRRA